MGKDLRKKKEDALTMGPTRALRENAKITSNLSRLASVSTIKKMQHLQRLAVWAAGEGSIPPLGALLGTRLAAAGETSRIPPPDSPFFTCERCETILQPGLNCRVRVWKHPRKARHKPRSFSKLANVVVYTCNFCLRKNMKPGTPEDYLRKRKTQTTPIAMHPTSTKKIILKKGGNDTSCKLVSSHSTGSNLTTPTSSIKKRKRKAWSMLKELTNSNQKPPSFSNLSALKIPSFAL